MRATAAKVKYIVLLPLLMNEEEQLGKKDKGKK